MLSSKYAPTSQKSLFHKDVINNFRKWLCEIQDLANSGESVQRVCLLYGPVGCGKTSTVLIMLKAYNVISINTDELRSIERISEVITGIAGYNDVTLANIEFWNKGRQKQEKPNIVLLDNSDLCEKNISGFIDAVYKKANINVPIVLVCSNKRTHELIKECVPNTRIFDFPAPSLLELLKLAENINQKEQLSLTKDNIKDLIKTSKSDTAQLCNLLQQWLLQKRSNDSSNFKEFLETTSEKFNDIDLIDKMTHVFNSKSQFDMDSCYTMCTSEPSVISNGIFQNYLNLLSKSEHHSNSISTSETISDLLSFANTTHAAIFENQLWELQDTYVMDSCVLPIYSIQKFKKEYDTENVVVETFRDVSHNFANSFDDIKGICAEQLIKREHAVNNVGSRFLLFETNIESCLTLSSELDKCVDTLNTYLNKNKKKTNTSKAEKIQLYKQILQSSTKMSLDFLVNTVYSYHLYEICADYHVIGSELRKQDWSESALLELIVRYHDRIDIRLTKRFINIFTVKKPNIIRSHSEFVIKGELLRLLFLDMKQNINITKQMNKIEHLVEDLSGYWNI